MFLAASMAFSVQIRVEVDLNWKKPKLLTKQTFRYNKKSINQSIDQIKDIYYSVLLGILTKPSRKKLKKKQNTNANC